MTSAAFLFAAVAIVQPCAGIAYTEETETFRNPGQGWSVVPGNWDKATNCVNVGVVYDRIAWTDLEPEEGRYDFSIIDDQIKFAVQRGVPYHFRIKCASKVSNNESDTPQWVYEKGCRYFTFDHARTWRRLKDGTRVPAGKLRCPYFEDPVFLEAHGRFVRALAARYDGDPRIFAIDIGSYGHFGEWHMSAFGVPKQKLEADVASRRRIADMYLKNFKKTRLVFLTGDETTLVYALGGDSLHPRTGMRRDAIGLPGYAEMWAGSERYKCVPNMGEVWKWQPLCFEWGGISRNIYEGKATTPKGKRMPKPEEMPGNFDWIREKHGTTINSSPFAPWFVRPDDTATLEAMRRCDLCCGARLVPLTCAHERRGGKLSIDLRLVNKGTSRIYMPYVLQAVARSASGDEIGSVSLAADPGSWLPGEHRVRETVELPGRIPADARLSLRLRHVPGVFPDFRFAAKELNAACELRCAPHPALLRDGKTIALNAMIGGTRRVVLLDVTSLVEKDFSYAWEHPRLVAVRLQDDTDHHDDLWFETEYLLSRCEAPFDVSAPALFIEDSLSGEGMAFFRKAPLPHARTDKTHDFRVNPGKRRITVNSTAYPCVRVPYTGGAAGRVRAATDFQRALRPYVPGRDGVFLSNTWGDGNRDACINDAFMRREIAAGAELGVDVIQIDDGWQQGRTANSSAIRNRSEGRWSAYWDNPHFWDVDRVRFPDGLAGLVSEARAKGMKFGLWFGPDSSDEAKNWSRDADFLLGLHRDLGIDYFKLDSMRSETATALARQADLFSRLMKESGNRITVDLDVTAGVRPGYYGFPEIGPVFVENRYIKPRGRDSRLWWPHRTLRNLWGLAHVVDPARLRMEVLNPCRLPDAYPDNDPLAPMRWPREAVFAISMFASPLGWFEIQNLDAETVAAWRPLVARWRRERDDIHSGYIYPVGSPPDGMVWTGFLAAAKDGGGHALMFRELSPNATFALDLSPYRMQGCVRAEVIGGRGTATVTDGMLSVSVPDSLGFVWVKMSAPSKKECR